MDPHQNIIWITSGLLTIARIFARILAVGFTTAVHWWERTVGISTFSKCLGAAGFPEPWYAWVLRRINLLVLRTYWADSQKSLCGEATRWFHCNHWSVLISFVILFSDRDWRARNIGWPDREKFAIISSAIRSRDSSGFCAGSARFFFWSRLQERPMTAMEFASIFRNCLWIVHTLNFVSLCIPYKCR